MRLQNATSAEISAWVDAKLKDNDPESICRMFKIILKALASINPV